MPPRLLPAVLVAVLASGCGYVGGPLPPLANIPARVNDLSAVQRGGRIIVRFTAPKLTTESMPIRQPLRLDLRVGPAGEPFQPDDWAAQAKQIPEVTPSEKGLATYELSSADWTNKEIVFGVRSIAGKGKESGWSNFAVLPVVPAPEKPVNLRAELTAAGPRLVWTAPGARFRIFRKQGSAEFAPAATIDGREWIDGDAEVGKSYQYRVETVVDLGNNREAESDPSDPLTVTHQDRFPPAAPTGLNASGAPGSVQLAWDQNGEPDLAGYRVYRAAPGKDFEKLADVSQVPTYWDKTATAGETYRYVVTAVDQAGNESPRSPMAEAAAQ